MLRSYVGEELPIFFEAVNFHRYYLDLFGACIRGRVLEVGAGLGALTRQLLERDVDEIVLCEPDPGLATALRTMLGDRGTLVEGEFRDVPGELGRFDAIVYVDVLEHIDDDRAEIAAAVERLAPGGCLLIGGPAHRSLFSPFDSSVGHRRRYDRRMIDTLIVSCPPLELCRFAYFDCLGALLSLGNRWIQRRTMPSRRQIRFWNGTVLPLSRCLDPLFNYRIGKSFVAVACRRGRGR